MKHTFWYIDKIMEILAEMTPKYQEYKIESDAQKIRAREHLDKLKEYDHILRRLIHSHSLERHLQKLHECHIDSIPDWIEKVSEQMKKLNALLNVLDEDIPKLEHALKNDPHTWGSKVSDMSLGIVMEGFYDYENSMKEFIKLEIFKKKHLLEIIGDLTDIEHMLN